MSDLYTKTIATLEEHALLKQAFKAAEMHSEDRYTKIGVVVVTADGTVVEGYNSLPVGVKGDEQRLERPTPETHPEGDFGKYDWLHHAERKAICHAARDGVALKGAKMYAMLMPCMNCAQAVVDSGIAELVLDYDFTETYRAKGNRWEYDFQRVALMFAEAGVKVRAISISE